MLSAFMSTEWARRAGLRPEQVINLAVNDGQFWDARYMLHEAGTLPSSVELVLVEVARWNFNRNRIAPLRRIRTDYPEHLRQQGDLLDRASVDGGMAVTRLLAELVWPTYQRRSVTEWIQFVTNVSPATPGLPFMSDHWDEKKHAAIQSMQFLKADTIVKDHFNDPEMSSFANRNFRVLVGEIRGQGAELVLVSLPTRTAYQEVVHADPEMSRLADSIDALVASMVGERVYAVGCKLASRCDLSQSIFVDYGHLNRDGAQAFTRTLYDQVEAARVAHSP